MWRMLSLTGLLLFGAAQAAEPMKEDNVHVRTWNAFADNVLQLHYQLVNNGKKTTVKQTTGGYANRPDFYKQEEYYQDGRLISAVRWEIENPRQMHTIEVFIHDDKGRVIRDYTAAYLPTYRNAPSQTLITLHSYNGKLHAFRTFDASGYRIVERCDGTLHGKPVTILLDEDEIDEFEGDPDSIMGTEAYKQCFAGLQLEAGKYLTPQ